MTVDPIDELMREYHQGYADANDPNWGGKITCENSAVAEGRAKIDEFLDSAKDAKTPLEFYVRLGEWIDKNPTACP